MKGKSQPKKRARTKYKPKPKGISPTIAAIILIIIAIGLGSVLASQLKETPKAQPIVPTEIICGGNIDYSITEVDSIPMICYEFIEETEITKVKINFEAENNGLSEIQGFKIRVITEKGILEKEILSLLELTQTKIYSQEYHFGDYGNFNQVKIKPIMKFNEAQAVCLDHSTIFSQQDIKQCPLY